MTVPQPFQYQGSKRALAPLARLLALIVNNPKELGKFYWELWRADHEDALGHYYQVRESFNRTQDPQLLLYDKLRLDASKVGLESP